MRNACVLALPFALAFTAAAAGAEPAWSEPVDGLRGRLVVDGLCETDGYVNVFVELENVGPRAVSVAVGAPTLLRPRLADTAGIDVPAARDSTDATRERSWHVIEPRERLTFLASQRPGKEANGPQIDMVTRAWRLDPGRDRERDGMLSATFRGPEGPANGSPGDAWVGEIHMPARHVRVFPSAPECFGASSEGHSLFELPGGCRLAQWQPPTVDKDCPTTVRIVGPDGVVRRTWTGWRFYLVRPAARPGHRQVAVGGAARSRDATGFAADLTGDGVPEICLMEWTGGAHAWFTYWVVSLGEEPEVLRELDLGNSQLSIIDLDGDGVHELVTTDDCLAYAYGCYAASAFPPMGFEWRDGGYRLATDRYFAQLARAIPHLRRYDGDETRDEVRRVLAGDWHRWLDAARETGRPALSDQSDAFMTVLRTVLGKYYRGRPGEAFEFLDRVWPDDVPGKAEYVARLRKELAASRFRSDLDAMFARAADDSDRAAVRGRPSPQTACRGREPSALP